MIGIAQLKDRCAAQKHHLLGMRKHGTDFAPEGLFDLYFDIIRAKGWRHIVHDHQDARHIKPTSNIDHGACALIVLLIEVHQDDEGVGNSYG